LELSFIKQLEQLKNVRFYFEQPVQVTYWRGRRRQTYTPDFGVFLDTNEFIIVEVKDLPGMIEYRTQMKIEGLMNFCSKRGFGLLFTDGRNTVEKINKVKCNRKLENDILRTIETGTIRRRECNELMKKHNAKQHELLKIILKNNLRYRSFPLQIKEGRQNPFFYKVFIEKKRYDDIIFENFPAKFKSG